MPPETKIWLLSGLREHAKSLLATGPLMFPFVEDGRVCQVEVVILYKKLWESQKKSSYKNFIQELYYHKPATQKQINTINNMVGRYII